MSEQFYKDFFEEAMNQIRDEYIANGKERDFKFYFNLEYIEDTFDTITVSVPSELMWRQMEKNGSAEKIQQKINELTAQEIKLLPIAKNTMSAIASKTSAEKSQPAPAQATKAVVEQKSAEVEPFAKKEVKADSPFDFGEAAFSVNFNPTIQTHKAGTPQSEKNNDGLEKFNRQMASLNRLIETEKEKERTQKEAMPQMQAAQGQYSQLFSNNQVQPQGQQTPQAAKDDYNDDYQNYIEQQLQKMNQTSMQKNLPQLREDYTFDNFIPGASTQYAYSAAKMAAEAPGKDYNPMLIYGGVGLGKTHLMQAIGHYIFEHNQSSKICYISAESFTNEFIASTQRKTTDEFKKKYRNLDVLLLDDIQFLEGKEATQEELFHTFNAIYDRRGQLVFTCDRPISEISGITKRLSTRFARGMNLDLQPPDYETRRAILEQKMASRGKKVQSEIIDYIAQNVQSNVRDLESCMKKVIGYSELMEEELTLSIAKDLLRDRIDSDAEMGNVTVESIQQAVAKKYDLKLADLIGKKKSKQYVLPRQIAIYISRKLMNEYSLKDIGIEFGGRDHTTVISAIEKVEALVKTKPEIAAVVKQLEKEAHVQH
jgi:chromosomal replication initiator protein